MLYTTTTMKSVTPLLSRRLLHSINRSKNQRYHLQNISHLSTKIESRKVEEGYDISKHLSGVSKADIESNPILADYLASNIPEIFGKSGDDHWSKEVLDANPHLVELLAQEDGLEGAKIKKKTRHGRERERVRECEIVEADGNASDLRLEMKLQQREQRQGEANNLNIRPLFGYTRDKVTEEGTRRCDTLRDQNLMIPGLLYGKDPTLSTASNVFVKTPWSEIQRELDLYRHNRFESRVYDLTVYDSEHPDSDDEGTVYRVLPRDVQYHPVQHKLYCCNYLRYFPGRPVNIPIVYTNEEDSAALKRGGFIAPISRYVTCVVEDGVPIPEGIELDCTGIQLKDVLRMERIVFPEGVTLDKKVNREKFLVGTVFGRRSDMDDEDAAEGSKATE